MQVVYKMSYSTPPESKDPLAQKLISALTFEGIHKFNSPLALFGDINLVWPLKILHFKKYMPAIEKVLPKIQGSPDLTSLLAQAVLSFEQIICRVLPDFECKNILWRDEYIQTMEFLRQHFVGDSKGRGNQERFTDPRYNFWKDVEEVNYIRPVLFDVFHITGGHPPRHLDPVIFPDWTLYNQKFMFSRLDISDLDFGFILTNTKDSSREIDKANIYYGPTHKSTFASSTFVGCINRVLRGQNNSKNPDNLRTLYKKFNKRMREAEIPIFAKVDSVGLDLSFEGSWKIAINSTPLQYKEAAEGKKSKQKASTKNTKALNPGLS